MKRALPLLALLAVAAPATRAAESYDNCAGTIPSLPAVLTTQGVWCMKADLATAVSSGHAITVSANNITIDCNGFKLGGLAAGPATDATGIYASGRLNTTVRNCNVRGFRYGFVSWYGDGGIIEDSRFEGNTQSAISGTHLIVRRNLVADTGGAHSTISGIHADGASVVEDNVVKGLSTTLGEAYLNAIIVGDGSSVSRNRVLGMVSPPAGFDIAINLTSGGAAEGNHVLSAGTDYGIACGSSAMLVARNSISGTVTPLYLCSTVLDNLSAP